MSVGLSPAAASPTRSTIRTVSRKIGGICDEHVTVHDDAVASTKAPAIVEPGQSVDVEALRRACVTDEFLSLKNGLQIPLTGYPRAAIGGVTAKPVDTVRMVDGELAPHVILQCGDDHQDISLKDGTTRFFKTDPSLNQFIVAADGRAWVLQLPGADGPDRKHRVMRATVGFQQDGRISLRSPEMKKVEVICPILPMARYKIDASPFDAGTSWARHAVQAPAPVRGKGTNLKVTVLSPKTRGLAKECLLTDLIAQSNF